MPFYKDKKEAVELTEMRQTKETLDSATALVDEATLHKEALTKKLIAICDNGNYCDALDRGLNTCSKCY